MTDERDWADDIAQHLTFQNWRLQDQANAIAAALRKAKEEGRAEGKEEVARRVAGVERIIRKSMSNHYKQGEQSPLEMHDTTPPKPVAFDDWRMPYAPTLLYFKDSDKYEFVQSDELCVYINVVPGIDYIYDAERDHVIGFTIDGALIRKCQKSP